MLHLRPEVLELIDGLRFNLLHPSDLRSLPRNALGLADGKLTQQV